MQVFQTLASAVLVVSMMLALGLQLRPRQIVEILRAPGPLIGIAVVNLLVVPALAWGLVEFLALPVPVAIGLMLCAAAPGGPAAALYSNTARSDLALTGALTVLLPTAGLVTTPAILSVTLELPEGARLPVLPIVGSLLIFQATPLVVGMLVRRRAPARAERLAPIASKIANATLAMFLVVMFVVQGETLLEVGAPSWIAFFALALVSLGLGYLVFLRRRDSARSGAFVTVSRNVSVAIMLASTFFEDPRVDLTVLTFGLVVFLLPLWLGMWWRRHPTGP
jgi:BASS family bile acid:Na+ symporter